MNIRLVDGNWEAVKKINTTLRQKMTATLGVSKPSMKSTAIEVSIYKLQKKLDTHESRASFLRACLRYGLIPKGLTIKNNPTVPQDGLGKSVWFEWSHILHRTSTRFRLALQYDRILRMRVRCLVVVPPVSSSRQLGHCLPNSLVLCRCAPVASLSSNT